MALRSSAVSAWESVPMRNSFVMSLVGGARRGPAPVRILPGAGGGGNRPRERMRAGRARRPAPRRKYHAATNRCAHIQALGSATTSSSRDQAAPVAPDI